MTKKTMFGFSDMVFRVGKTKKIMTLYYNIILIFIFLILVIVMPILIEPKEMIVHKSDELVLHSEILNNPELNDLSAREQRMKDYLISKITPTSSELDPIRFTTYEYCKEKGISYNGRSYQEVLEDIRKLAQKKVWITEIDEHNKKKVTLCGWVGKAEFYPESGNVDVYFDSSLAPHIFHLDEEGYDLGWADKCGTKYAARLFEFCWKSLPKENRQEGSIISDFAALKKRLSVYNIEYYSEFKRRVLQIAMKAINEFSPYSISMTEMIEGKEKKIIFHFKRNGEPTVRKSYCIAAAPDLGDLNGRIGEPAVETIHVYGEYGWVKMSEQKHSELVELYGEDVTERSITYIDESAQTSNNRNGWADWFLIVKRCAEKGWYEPRVVETKKPYRGKTFNDPSEGKHQSGEEIHNSRSKSKKHTPEADPDAVDPLIKRILAIRRAEHALAENGRVTDPEYRRLLQESKGYEFAPDGTLLKHE